MISACIRPTYEAFRQRCRELLAAEVAPEQVAWSDSSDSQLMLLSADDAPVASTAKVTVPRSFVELARIVSSHSDPARWHLLYSVLWRVTHGERNLLSVHIDDQVLRLNRMRQEVARDVHHMHAFVRFRRVERDGDEWFIAWYKPDHPILRLAAPFFAERFAAMKWAILTPGESVYWNGESLQFGGGVPRSSAPGADELESLWSAYYRTTFNPARMNLDLMRQELPVRFWENLPEVQHLSTVVSEAPERLARMQKQQSASALSLVPRTQDLMVLQQAAASCDACPLHCNATQTVFGEGPASARVVLVGEQPGDLEDELGRPFVGPAGEVLNRALAEAGVLRADVYLTNAVKHFKFAREGKRRIHQTPRMSEIIACKPWLEAELEAIRPMAIVLMGATAAKSLLGGTVKVTQEAGKVLRTRFAEHTIISVHPSFVLRSVDASQSRAAYERLVADLATVRKFAIEQRATAANEH
ncbi:MAG TPA: UdgX family uracil-DNA binding protein [Terriglobales bacterium]